MPKCFVIMPYGGEDEEKRRQFDGVYHAVIRPAAEAAGYSVKRSDIAGEPGNITQDIIKDLAEAEIVVADLTTGNPNVFLELGIRHVLRKGATIHIISEDDVIPFDVRSYRAVKYSRDLARVPEVIELIQQQIKKREEQPERSDNPVHDALTGLPINYLAISDEATRRNQEQMQAAIHELEAERDDLARRLEEIDPGGTLQSSDELDVDTVLDEADATMSTTGENALVRLHQAIEKDGRNGFTVALREILKNPFLDDNDYAGITLLCQGLGLSEHRRAVLELAVSRNRGADQFQGLLAAACIDSPNGKLQDRGRLMLESLLGVEHTAAGPTLVDRPTLDQPTAAIGFLFNAYIRRRQWSWVVSLSESAEKHLGEDSVLLRNRARAIAKLGDKKAAEELFKRAIAADSSDDSARAFYSDFLDDEGRYEESYKEHEEALKLDREDPSRWLNLAIFILNRGYARRGSQIASDIPKKDRKRYAIPLILRAIELGDRNPEVVQSAATVLVRAKAVAEAQAIAQGETPPGDFDVGALEGLEGDSAPD